MAGTRSRYGCLLASKVHNCKCAQIILQIYYFPLNCSYFYIFTDYHSHIYNYVPNIVVIQLYHAAYSSDIAGSHLETRWAGGGIEYKLSAVWFSSLSGTAFSTSLLFFSPNPQPNNYDPRPCHPSDEHKNVGCRKLFHSHPPNCLEQFASNTPPLRFSFLLKKIIFFNVLKTHLYINYL